MDEGKLIPEDNLQELWQRNGELEGRIYSALAYMKYDQYAKTEIIIRILGGDPDESKEEF